MATPVIELSPILSVWSDSPLCNSKLVSRLPDDAYTIPREISTWEAEKLSDLTELGAEGSLMSTKCNPP